MVLSSSRRTPGMGPQVAVDGHINVALARRPTESGGVGKGAHGRGVATGKAHAESRSLSDRGDGPGGVRHRCCTSIPALVRRSCQDRDALIVVWPSFIRWGGAGVRNKVSALQRTRQTIYRNILRTAENPLSQDRISSTSSAYFSSLAAPIPLIRSSACRSVGRTSARASRVASEKTTYAGTASASARSLRQALSEPNSSSS